MGAPFQDLCVLQRSFFAYQTDSVPVADAIDTSCSNRYYAHPARYKSAWVRHSKTFAFCKGLFFAYQTDSVPVADRKQRQIKRVAFDFVARSGHRLQNGKINKFCSAGKTYGEAIDTYYRILEEKKTTKTTIEKQFEYNTYIRDFFADNPQRTLKDAVACWKYKKSLQGHNRYERSDLVAID